jgi:Thiolase, C-terminal domain
VWRAQLLNPRAKPEFARESTLNPADVDRLTVNGSAISLGHRVAPGARILATLTREMHRRQARFGLETECIGGGQGVAAVSSGCRSASTQMYVWRAPAGTGRD